MNVSMSQYRIKRVTLHSACRVWCSYTKQVGCISFLDTLKFSDRQTHVHRLPSIPMSCMSSPKTLPSSLLACHISSSYYIPLVSEPNVNSRIS